MSKLKCQWKECNSTHSDLGFLLGKRRIPRFEDQFFCSPDCLRSHLQRDLGERWRRLEKDKGRITLRPKLGTILLRTTLLTPAQLHEAINLQKQSQTGRLGEWLTRLGFLDERHITQAIARQYSLPIIDLRHSGAKAEALQLVPAEIARSSRCLPVSLDDEQSTLSVAMTGPINFNLADAMRRMLRKNVLVYVGDKSAIESLIDRWYKNEAEQLKNTPVYCSLEDLCGMAADIVDAALERRADNIQIELLPEFLWVRFDLPGECHHIVFRYVLPVAQNLTAAQH